LDPLRQVKDAHEKGLIPDATYDMIIKRFPTTVEGINRIERASGIKFPVAYVEPKLVITTTDPTFGYGILYARTIPVALENEFTIVIQITAPLVE